MFYKRITGWALGTAFAAALAASGAMAASEVRIGVVNDYAGWNPYADSTAQMYMTWCQTYGLSLIHI